MIRPESITLNLEKEFADRLVAMPDFAMMKEGKRQEAYDAWIKPFEGEVSVAQESRLVMRTWLRELPSHPSAAGVLYAMGVEVHKGQLNKTPHLIAIPIDHADLANLKQITGGEKARFEAQAEMFRTKLQDKLLAPTEYREKVSTGDVPLPVTNLNIINGGWGNRPENWVEHIDAIIDAFENVDNIPGGVQATDQIFLAQGPLGAHKTTPEGDNWRTVQEEALPTQPVEALLGLVKDLIGTKDISEDDALKNLAQKVSNVFGHSMHGFALLLNLTGNTGTLLELLNKAGNRHAKFHVMNTVVGGSEIGKKHDEMARIRKLFSDTMTLGADQTITLLVSNPGILVQQSGWLMQSEFIGRLAHFLKIDVGMIRGFLGEMGETLVPLLSHVSQIKNDPRQTMMDNKLLKSVGFVIKDSRHMKRLRELAEAGRLTMWMGDKDAIVTPEEEWLLAYWLGINKYIETTNHYADKRVMGMFLPAMLAPVGRGGVGERLPGIFKDIPEYNVLKRRIMDRKVGITGWVRKLVRG